MVTKDPRVDAYIEEAAEFARPILLRLRKIVHQGCPAGTETIKWGCPFFDYYGLLCGFAAFKAHCSFFFWRDIDVSAASTRPPRRALAWDNSGRLPR